MIFRLETLFFDRIYILIMVNILPVLFQTPFNHEFLQPGQALLNSFLTFDL